MLARCFTIFIFALGFTILQGCSQESSESETPKKTQGVSFEVAIGESIVNKNCKVCHAQGINGAPILGNKKMWGKRVPQGVDTLVEHAIEGYGLMPPKGGNQALTKEEIHAAVEYMVSRVAE
ncbi:MAG: c-type cytochrome [Cellvibrionaceae bacterium]